MHYDILTFRGTFESFRDVSNPKHNDVVEIGSGVYRYHVDSEGTGYWKNFDYFIYAVVK